MVTLRILEIDEVVEISSGSYEHTASQEYIGFQIYFVEMRSLASEHFVSHLHRMYVRSLTLRFLLLLEMLWRERRGDAGYLFSTRHDL